MKRYINILFVIFCITAPSFSQITSDSQILNPDNKIYETVKQLQMNTKTLFFTQNTPVSVGEIKFYLKQLDYENLSDTAKQLYDEVNNSFSTELNFYDDGAVKVYANPRLNLEGYYKTNENIPWTNKYFFVDNLMTFPVALGLGNLFSIQSDLFIGKNLPAIQKSNNYTNIPLDVKDFEFFYPTYAYGSFGQTFEKWGYNFHIGKQGKTVGDTLTGSILFNNTFETDAYTELSLFSKFIKYTGNVVQISSNRMDTVQGDCTDRFMYINQYDIRFFKRIKLSVFEASLVANPFQIRFMNPLIFMHQYGGWTDSSTKSSEGKYRDHFDAYKETNFCAYFAAMLEVLPATNLRFYGIYNQVEMQLPWERAQNRGRYYPNSIGIQAGGEYNLFLNNAGVMNFAIEGVYTSPYLYVKQTPSASLYRVRTDMQTKETVYSWIGSPFGPDCIAGQFKFNYKPTVKQEYEFDYVISAKGKNDFDMFEKKYDDIYSYYPSVVWWLITEKDYPESYDDLYEDAISLKISGIPVITNQFCLKGSYLITPRIKISGKAVYSYIINFNHEKNNKESGFEFSLATTFTLFE